MLAGCSTGDTIPVPQGPSEIRFLNVGEGVEFVGDVACFDCHETEYNGFNEHGMSRSMYRLTAETAVESFGSEIVVDSSSGLHYQTVESDSGFFMLEFLLDTHGNRVHELRREMQYVVGSGTTARTYLTEQDGWFYELPVTWYTQQERWDFSPGYRVANKRFDRKVADRCMVCHNSYPTPVAQTNGMYSEMPLGIGCERCHGPGSLHVNERLSSSEPQGDYDASIVNPAHLTLERRLDVCQQCHQNGSVSLLRDGRTAYDFRPSESLSDYVAFFQAHDSAESGDIEVISHADRLKLSACFLDSITLDTPLECTTCHDPHNGFRDQGPEFFNETCIGCHGTDRLALLNASDALDTHSLDANCIECHMPKTDLIDAPHSAFTDHWIRVVKNGEGGQPEVAHDENTLTARFERDRSGQEDADLYAGMAYITRGFQKGEPDMMHRGIAILAGAFDDGQTMSEALYLHGYANVLLGQFESAIPTLEESLRLDPQKTERLNTLAQAYEGAGRDPSRIERLYREALRIQPRLSDVRINYGRFLETRSRVDEAIAQYREVIRSESWSVLGYYNLGTALLRQGELEQAELNLQAAIGLDPFHGGALSNLGLVQLQRGKQAEALQTLEMAVERNPEHAESLENLGSLLLNSERLPDAIVLLLRAVEANPRSADTYAKLGLAYFRSDNFVNARISAQSALRLNPSHPLATQILQAL